ncbi:MAG: porin family protein [Alphaproteobacteria bacterium]|nr:porin family protein [Alphaproteobacteria bacterium]
MRKTLLLAGVASLFAAQAQAADFFFKPYVGLDYIHSWTDVETEELDDGTEIKDNKDHMNAGAVSVGAKFHPNFAVEAFYQQSDKAKKNLGNFVYVDDISGDAYNVNLKTEVKYKAFGLDLVGSIPVSDKLEILGTVGTGHYKVNYKVMAKSGGISKSDSNSKSKWGIRIGAGLQYNFNEHISARMMLRNTNTRIEGFKNITDITAGVRYYF